MNIMVKIRLRHRAPTAPAPDTRVSRLRFPADSTAVSGFQPPEVLETGWLHVKPANDHRRGGSGRSSPRPVHPSRPQEALRRTRQGRLDLPRDTLSAWVFFTL